MLRLRDLIFATAAATPGVGTIDEDLRWGQPAYLTAETQSGTALRLGYIEATDTAAVAYKLNRKTRTAKAPDRS